MERNNNDEIDEVDYAASGEVSRSTLQTNGLHHFHFLDLWYLIHRYGFELQNLNISLKEAIHGVSNARYQENRYYFQEEDRDGDGDIHRPVVDQWELNPHRPDSFDEAEISIADNKRSILPGDGRDLPPARIDAEQEKGGLPSYFNTAHSIAPSGSNTTSNFITFMSVLTSRSVFNTSVSTSVDTEMNNAAGDAYCFGNAFVGMNDLDRSSAAPVLHDSAQMSTQSFENAVASNDNDGGNAGHDESIDGLKIDFLCARKFA